MGGVAALARGERGGPRSLVGGASQWAKAGAKRLAEVRARWPSIMKVVDAIGASTGFVILMHILIGFAAIG